MSSQVRRVPKPPITADRLHREVKSLVVRNLSDVGPVTSVNDLCAGLSGRSIYLPDGTVRLRNAQVRRAVDELLADGTLVCERTFKPRRREDAPITLIRVAKK